MTSVGAAGASKTTIGVKPPANPIDYPIVFTRHTEAPDDGTWTSVGIFSALQWLLPVFQLAGWIAKNINSEQKPIEGKEGNGSNDRAADATGENGMYTEVENARRLLPYFEQFFSVESKVVPNGALFYTVQAFRFPTPRGPRSITRAFVESPGKYFSPLQEEKGGGHFLCCYEERRLLRCLTYLQLDQLRFAWVAVKELMEEHKAVQRTDGALTGLARRDIKKNNGICNDTASKVVNSLGAGGMPITAATTRETTAAPAIQSPAVAGRASAGSNIITGLTAEARKTREELREKKYLSDLLREECAARWPHTPAHKSVIFLIEEQQMEAAGGRKGRKGPRMYLATVELPLLNKKGGLASFKGTQWCTSRRDAENMAAEVALRALRTIKV